MTGAVRAQGGMTQHPEEKGREVICVHGGIHEQTIVGDKTRRPCCDQVGGPLTANLGFPHECGKMMASYPAFSPPPAPQVIAVREDPSANM